MKVNKLYNEDNILTLRRIKSKSIDLIVTSPPYDDLRTYNSYINSNIFKELFRVLKDGGVLCWNVFDEKQKNGYSATSLNQCLRFIDAGFNLHQYLIYEKNSIAFNARKNGKLYTNIFEFVFVLSKGCPKTVNLICDKRNKYAGQSSYDGKVKEVAEFSPRTTIWKYTTSQNEKSGHPAVMPEKLALDLIKTYSNEGDTVYDPYMGSGTTIKMAHATSRNYIGSEISEDYFKETKERLSKYFNQQKLF